MVDEALILTKKISDTLNPKKSKIGRVNWTPTGTIRVFDTRLNGMVHVAGLHMRVRRWFITHRTSTDWNGNYNFSPLDYDRPANYSLVLIHRYLTFGVALLGKPG